MPGWSATRHQFGFWSAAAIEMAQATTRNRTEQTIGRIFSVAI